MQQTQETQETTQDEPLEAILSRLAPKEPSPPDEPAEAPAPEETVVEPEETVVDDVEVRVRRRPGRPRTKPRVVYVDDERMEPVAVVRRPVPPRTPTVRELREVEAHERFVKLEQAAGKKLSQRRNGEVDKRSLLQRPPAQIEATRRLVAAGVARRAAAKQGKVEDSKAAIREAVLDLQAAPARAPVVPKLQTRDEYLHGIMHG